MNNPSLLNGGVPKRDTTSEIREPITVAAMQHQFAEDAQTLKQQAFVYPSHEQVMENLLSLVEKVVFESKAELDSNNEKDTLKTRHYLIIVTEELLALATKNKWGLCRRYSVFYTFNGSCWKAIENDDLRAFLRKAAEKMGVKRFTARYFGFSKQLFEQFTETAYLAAPTSANDAVKINLANGTFEISPQCQKLRDPNSADFLTHQLPFAYDPTATAPIFQAFLDKVLPDKDCQSIVAEYLGYVFVQTAKLKLEKILLLRGVGANGKSVIFEIITALLGNENISHYSLRSLTVEPAYCRAHLGDKLLNYTSEIHGALETDTFKQLASGEPIEARLPHGQPFILRNYAKLVFNCNELPTDVEQTHAFFRRFLIIPFTVTIPEADQDRQLAAKIIASELSGVFNWVLEGLQRLLQQGGFTLSKAVNEQLDNYKQQSDSVRLFLTDNEYVVSTSPEDYVLLKEFYREYRTYCLEDGLYPVKKQNFHKRLETIGFRTERKNIGNVMFVRKAPPSTT